MYQDRIKCLQEQIRIFLPITCVLTDQKHVQWSIFWAAPLKITENKHRGQIPRVKIVLVSVSMFYFMDKFIDFFTASFTANFSDLSDVIQMSTSKF